MAPNLEDLQLQKKDSSVSGYVMRQTTKSIVLQVKILFPHHHHNQKNTHNINQSKEKWAYHFW